MKVQLVKALPAGQFGYMPRGSTLVVADDAWVSRLVADGYAVIQDEQPVGVIIETPVIAATAGRRKVHE